MRRKEIIKHLVKHNESSYNILKAAEELNELSLILIQYLNKPTKVNTQEIIDEIGDVYIRIKVIEKMFGSKKVNDRIKFKFSKLKQYIKNKEYLNRT